MIFWAFCSVIKGIGKKAKRMMKKKSKLLGAVFSMTGFVVFSKLIGFVKQMVTAAYFGTSIETDLLSLSQGLISNIEYVLAQTLLTSFTAVYIYIRKKDENEANIFTENVHNIIVLLSACVIVLLLICAPILAKIIAPSYTSELHDKLSTLLRIHAPVFLLFSLCALYRAMLNANEKFALGEFTSILQNIIIIGFVVLLGNRIGPNSLIWSTYAYSLINIVYLVCVTQNERRETFKPTKMRDDPNVKEFLKMSAPLFFGYAVVYINQLVDKILVSGLDTGSVTALSYASVLSNLVCTLMTTLSTILFTYITKELAEGNVEKANILCNRTVFLVSCVIIPITIVVFISAKEIVEIVFKRGQFDANSVSIASHALQGYAIMFLPYSVRGLYNQLQYAYKNSKKPMFNNTIAIIVNVVLSIILCQIFGVFGVALATSLASFTNMFLNILSAKRICKDLNYGYFRNKVIPISLATIMCIVFTALVYKHIDMSSSLLKFTLISVIAIVSFSPCAVPLIIKEIKR